MVFLALQAVFLQGNSLGIKEKGKKFPLLKRLFINK